MCESGIVHEASNLPNGKGYVRMGPNGGIHERSNGLAVRVSGHLADVRSSSGAVIAQQGGICNDGNGKRLGVFKSISGKEGINIRALRYGEGSRLSVPFDLEPKHPVDLA